MHILLQGALPFLLKWVLLLKNFKYGFILQVTDVRLGSRDSVTDDLHETQIVFTPIFIINISVVLTDFIRRSGRVRNQTLAICLVVMVRYLLLYRLINIPIVLTSLMR